VLGVRDPVVHAAWSSCSRSLLAESLPSLFSVHLQQPDVDGVLVGEAPDQVDHGHQRPIQPCPEDAPVLLGHLGGSHHEKALRVCRPGRVTGHALGVVGADSMSPWGPAPRRARCRAIRRSPCQRATVSERGRSLGQVTPGWGVPVTDWHAWFSGLPRERPCTAKCLCSSATRATAQRCCSYTAIRGHQPPGTWWRRSWSGRDLRSCALTCPATVVPASRTRHPITQRTPNEPAPGTCSTP
jgi:hypothetical protein